MPITVRFWGTRGSLPAALTAKSVREKLVAAQIVMVPMAMLVGAKADAWGRKPLLMAALAILPIRGALYTLSDNPFWLVAVQLLDGMFEAGAGEALFDVGGGKHLERRGMQPRDRLTRCARRRGKARTTSRRRSPAPAPTASRA